MNPWYHQKNAFASREEMCSPVSGSGSGSISYQRESVVCPKPQRFGNLANNPTMPFRWHMSHQAEVSDLKAGAELIDIIIGKGGYGVEQSGFQVAAYSPPFFTGSPPSRAANPLIQDARFGDEKLAPLSSPLQVPPPSGLSSPSSSSSSARKGGCVRMNFELKPATVRVEGFDCLNRDRQNSSIPAVA